MNNATYLFQKFIKPIIEWRWVIFYTILPLSFTWIVYFFVSSIYPDLAFYNYFKFTKTKYRFYSGSQSGSYYLIGDYLSKNSINNNYEVEIKNEETQAGYQNVLKVLSDVNSFGIVQGDVIRRNDIIRDEINYISPLYLEKMHIIYRVKSAQKHMPEYDGLVNLSLTSTKTVLNFFAKSRINVGPSGGGSCILASYLLSEINTQSKIDSIDISNQKITYNDVKSTFQEMKDTSKNNIDIAIYMGGAPNQDIKEIIEKGYRLAQIDLSLITKLNYTYNLNLRFTNLTGKYPFSDVLTFGSYAYLITQNTTPSKDIVNVLDNLISIGNHRKIDTNEESSTSSVREKIEKQIEDYSFFTTYRNVKEQYRRSKIMNFLLFIAISAIGIVGSIFTYKNSISNKIKNNFFSKLNKITHRNIPDNIIPISPRDIQNYGEKQRNYKVQITQIIETNDSKNDDIYFKIPFIQNNQTPIINKIIMGISQIFNLRNEFSDAYHESKLTNKDYLFLLQRSDQIVEKLRKNLGIRLISISNQNDMHAEIDTILIERYFTADYLLREDYEYLIKIKKA